MKLLLGLGQLLGLLPTVTAEPLRSHDSRLLQTAKGNLPGPYASVTLGTGPGGCSGTQEAVLDIYRGSGDGSHPTTTVLHLPGGAYMNILPITIESAGADYIAAGYTVAVLYYRLPRDPDDRPWIVCSDPWEAMEDVVAAVNLLRRDAEEYRVDSDRMVISGFSAGGHLGALYGATCGARGLFCPRSLVLHFPFLVGGAQIFCAKVGSPFVNLSPDEYSECFPTALVGSGAPPVVLYHASGDTIVPIDQMTALVEAMADRGVAHAYYEVPGGGHFLVRFQLVVDAHPSLEGTTYAALIEKSLGLASQECTRCDDTPSDWMVANGKTCAGSHPNFLRQKCSVDAVWAKFGYCRSSCFDAGGGYAGDDCCPTSPSVVPSRFPTEMPSSRPTTTRCTEGRGDLFLLKAKTKKDKLMTCRRLAKNPTRAASICSKRVDHSDTHGPAQAVCRVTCGSCGACYENGNSKWFLKREGGVPVYRTCRVLKKQTPGKVRALCGKEAAAGGYGPAVEVCPSTCGEC